jgi:hypothetical protein
MAVHIRSDPGRSFAKFKFSLPWTAGFWPIIVPTSPYYPVLIQDLLDVSGVLAFVFQVAPEYLTHWPKLTGFVRYHLALFGFAQPSQSLQHRLTHDFQVLPDRSAGFEIWDVCQLQDAGQIPALDSGYMAQRFLDWPGSRLGLPVKRFFRQVAHQQQHFNPGASHQLYKTGDFWGWNWMAIAFKEADQVTFPGRFGTWACVRPVRLIGI